MGINQGAYKTMNQIFKNTIRALLPFGLVNYVHKYHTLKRDGLSNSAAFNSLFRVAQPTVRWTNKSGSMAGYSVGEWTYGSPNVIDYGQDVGLKIGKYCSIASNVTILLGGEHRSNLVTTYNFKEMSHPYSGVKDTCYIKGDVVIEHDVWIGLGVVILSGVTIGSGAIIGAGSVVAKSVEPYSIVCGNPARHMRYRIDEHLISDMLQIAWWNWSDKKVWDVVPLLVSDMIQEFVRTYKQPGDCG